MWGITEVVQEQLDKLRARLGITGGFGMLPGDKGYIDDRIPAQQPAEKEITDDVDS
jgi:hypothetical protein